MQFRYSNEVPIGWLIALAVVFCVAGFVIYQAEIAGSTRLYSDAVEQIVYDCTYQNVTGVQGGKLINQRGLLECLNNKGIELYRNGEPAK